MNIVPCFGKNIFVGDEIVGYIRPNELVVNKHVFATITDDGEISLNEKNVGYVDDDGTIYINDREVGYVDCDNNFRFIKIKI